MINIFDRVIRRILREINLQSNRFQIWRVKRSFPKNLDNQDVSPVLVFNASTRLSGLSLNAGFSLITSLALQKNNIPTHTIYCDHGLTPCVLGTDRDDPEKTPPCRECTRTSRMMLKDKNSRSIAFKENSELKQKLMDLNLKQLLDFSFQSVPFGKLVHPSMRWILRQHHLEDNKKNRALARNYIQSAWSVFKNFSNLIDSLHPQAIVVFNGMFYPEAVARIAAQKKNVPAISHEVGMLPFSAFYTYEEATAYPVTVDEEFQLSKNQEARLDRYLEKRFQGNFQTAGVNFWPKIQHFNSALMEKINSYAFVVPIFTNVIFDTSQSHANTIFEHMFSWLDLVVDEIKKHPDTLFIIRAHPDEIRVGKESRESVSQWFNAHHLSKIPNLIFIPPDEFISSYELISIAKFVMVYNSTVGLEASIMGKPVLCAGKARYTQIPTVFFPDSKTSYRSLLSDFLQTGVVNHPPAMKANAKRVLYSQLFRASLPFDEFLKEDGVWPGYVLLRRFTPDKLLLGRSDSIDAMLNGILKQHSFIREI